MRVPAGLMDSWAVEVAMMAGLSLWRGTAMVAGMQHNLATDRLKVVFMGTGDIARPAFAALCGRGDVEVLGLVTQPDKPVGRHQVLTPPAIKVDALQAGFTVWQPTRAREMVAVLAGMDVDLLLVMAYGQLLPEELIALPARACWNLHASLLPRHRGASPIQAAILHGDTRSGVTVMHVVKALDAGDIVLAEAIDLRADETGGSLHDRLADLAPRAMHRALDALLAGTAGRVPQDPAQVTVLGKLTRSDGLIDWSQDAVVLERMVRAFAPWPGTHTVLPDGRILKVHPPVEVVGLDPPAGVPGQVLVAADAALVLACGSAALRLHRVQADGGRAMDVADYLHGHAPMPGVVWGGEPNRQP